MKNAVIKIGSIDDDDDDVQLLLLFLFRLVQETTRIHLDFRYYMQRAKKLGGRAKEREFFLSFARIVKGLVAAPVIFKYVLKLF